MIDFRCRVCFETLIWFQRRGCSLGRVRRQVLFPVRRSRSWSLLDRSCEDYISHATESRYLTSETFVTHLGSVFLETLRLLTHISSLERSGLALLMVFVCLCVLLIELYYLLWMNSFCWWLTFSYWLQGCENLSWTARMRYFYHQLCGESIWLSGLGTLGLAC